MTLVIGWTCEDGVVLAADDETMVKTEGRYPQKQSYTVKLKKVGHDCAVGVTSHVDRIWKRLTDLSDEYKSGDSVEVGVVADRVKQAFVIDSAQDPDLTFVIGGFKKTADGKSAVIYKVERLNNVFDIWEATGPFTFAGVTPMCQTFEQYIPYWKINRMAQAERAASILIALAANDAGGGVGPLGSIANITSIGGCVIKANDDTQEQLRQLAMQFQHDLRTCLEERILSDWPPIPRT